VATGLIAPTENPKLIVPAGLRRLLVCFSSSDDWQVLITIAGKLGLPGNVDVRLCYKDLTNLYPIDGTRFNGQERCVPFDSLPISMDPAKALRAMGLSVEFTDLPALRRERRQKLSSNPEADLIVMTTAFSASIALCSQAVASQVIRLLRSPFCSCERIRDRQPPRITPDRRLRRSLCRSEALRWCSRLPSTRKPRILAHRPTHRRQFS